jgi:hypothetical protein
MLRNLQFTLKVLLSDAQTYLVCLEFQIKISKALVLVNFLMKKILKKKNQKLTFLKLFQIFKDLKHKLLTFFQ